MASAEPMHHLENRVARFVAQMEPTKPDMIRAAPAYAALVRCAKPLRGYSTSSDAADLIRFSSVAARIKEFWSHSWHGPRWQKILTVLLMNNAWAATVASSIVATILGVFYLLDQLPEIPKVATTIGESSGWSLYSGLITYVLVLLFWPSRKQIFLDLLCINQGDDKEKAQALLSMGAFLKRSDSLVIFWDPTYTRRLWCVFELAAYLHSRAHGQPQRLVIRPTIVGPCFLSLTLALSMVFVLLGFFGDEDFGLYLAVIGSVVSICFYLTMSTFRSYFHAVRLCQNEMKEFDFNQALCCCCTSGHTKEDGTRIPCDRQILGSCIVQWFGSIPDFEQRVRIEMEECLSTQLLSQLVSYKQCVVSLVPFLWMQVDLASAETRLNIEYYGGTWMGGGVLELLRGLALWLGVGPLLLSLALNMASRYPEPRASRCGDVLLNLTIVLLIAALLMGILFVEPLLWHATNPFNFPNFIALEVGSAVFAATFILLALLSFRCFAPRAKPQRNQEACEEIVLDHTLGVTVNLEDEHKGPEPDQSLGQVIGRAREIESL